MPKFYLGYNMLKLFEREGNIKERFFTIIRRRRMIWVGGGGETLIQTLPSVAGEITRQRIPSRRIKTLKIFLRTPVGTIKEMEKKKIINTWFT